MTPTTFLLDRVLLAASLVIALARSTAGVARLGAGSGGEKSAQQFVVQWLISPLAKHGTYSPVQVSRSFVVSTACSLTTGR